MVVVAVRVVVEVYLTDEGTEQRCVSVEGRVFGGGDGGGSDGGGSDGGGSDGGGSGCGVVVVYVLVLVRGGVGAWW